MAAARHDLSMHLLQRADKALGLAVCAALQPLRWLRPLRGLLRSRARAPRVLLIKFWGIGSLQLLTPAVNSLRRRHPRAELVLLTLRENRDFAAALGAFDRVLTLDVGSPSWARIFARILALARCLRSERFEEVYDFEFFTRFSAVVSVLTGAPRTHGFHASTVWRGGLHTHVAPFNRYWHVARNFRVLAGGEDGLNVTASDLAACRFSEADEAGAAALLSELGIPLHSPLAVLNPNAGRLSLERRWPLPAFGELAARLAREDAVSVVLIGSSSERGYTQQVAELARAHGNGSRKGAIVNLAGRLTTGGLAALLARAAVVVSNDSGPMHIAAALGAPTVGLFGPETPVMYAPIGMSARALYRPPPCSPCINVHDNKVSSCIYGRPQCLVNIPVDEVLDAARTMLRGEDFVLRPRAPRPRVHSPQAEPA